MACNNCSSPCRARPCRPGSRHKRCTSWRHLAECRVAGQVAGRAVLGVGERVVGGIRVALALPAPLVRERLNRGHYRRGDRRPAESRPRVGLTRAGISARLNSKPRSNDPRFRWRRTTTRRGYRARRRSEDCRDRLPPGFGLPRIADDAAATKACEYLGRSGRRCPRR